MYPVQVNNEHTEDEVLLYGLQGTNFYKEIEKSEAMTREDAASKPDNKIEPFDEFAGLTDFERTLADICIGWIGEEPGWKQYIKDNADVLLRIAVEKFNSGKTLDKVCEWLLNNIRYYSTNALGAEYMCEDLRKAMEE